MNGKDRLELLKAGFWVDKEERVHRIKEMPTEKVRSLVTSLNTASINIGRAVCLLNEELERRSQEDWAKRGHCRPCGICGESCHDTRKVYGHPFIPKLDTIYASY